MISETTDRPRPQQFDSAGESGDSKSRVCCSWCGLPISPGWFDARKETASPPKHLADLQDTASGQKHAAARQELGADDANYCCSGCRFAHAMTQEKGAEGAVRWTVVRLGLSIFFTMNLMAFTMTMWSLDVYSVTPDPFQLKLFEVFRWVSMLFSLPVLLLLGFPLLREAAESWSRRIFSTDLLIATGVIAAYVTSIVNVLRDSPAVYFEVGAMVLVAVTLGRWLEAIGRQKATSELDQLAGLLPAKAYRTGHAVGADTVGDDSVDTEQIEIAAESIVVGDFLRIRAGERFPVDAVLVRGRTSVDEQVFTGESRPIEKNPGDRLLAGTVNLDGDLIVRATAALHEGSFSRLRQLLQEARNARGEYQRLADRVSAWFFPVISLVSLLTFAVHLSSGFGPAIQNTLSVLLIACPCALGLATPLAVWTALSTAIRYQVLFRSGEAIERLAVAESACFDKTGTLTTGMPRVVQFQSFAPDVPSAQVFALARQLAEASKHPYSRAISDWCAEAQLSLPRLRAEGQLPAVSEMRTVPGCGVLATTADASEIRLGSLTFTGATSDVLQKIQSSADTAQLSVTGLSLDGRLLAVFSMTESLRPEAASAIRDCLEMGLTVTVLTGDRRGRAVQLQEELQSRIAAESADSMVSQRTLPPINMISELQPADKVDAIRQLQKNVGRTVMVGDGINDAPALAISDAGIAMGCGADVSRDSAQVCLLGNDLTRIPWAISLARQTRSVIRQNLFWAFAYNGAGVALAAAGFLNPAIAAGLMIVSSLVVITNSLRLMQCRPKASEVFPQSAASSKEPADSNSPAAVEKGDPDVIAPMFAAVRRPVSSIQRGDGSRVCTGDFCENASDSRIDQYDDSDRITGPVPDYSSVRAFRSSAAESLEAVNEQAAGG